MGESRVIRNPWNVVVSWVFFPMLYLFGALASPRVVGLAVVGAAALAHWRFARLGVVVGSADLVVRNLVRDRRLAWTDIERFATTDSRSGPPVAILKDGRVVTMTGLTPPRSGGLRWLTPRLNRLNSHRCLRTASSACAESHPPNRMVHSGHSRTVRRTR